MRELSAETVELLGINTKKYNPLLFSGWRNKPTQFIKESKTEFLRQGIELLLEIEEKNQSNGLYEQNALRKVLLARWNWLRETCEIPFKRYEYDEFISQNVTPKISVVIPTYKAQDTLCRALDSVLDQTYADWEVLIINDFGSNDGTAEIVKMYGLFDSRIRLIQADRRLGLADSLNLGIREAKGEYIARLDADDTSYPERFAKQTALLDSRPEVGICGTWQRHYKKNFEWVHRATEDEQLLKARLLFWCDLCHSTLMLRKSVFVENNLFYDPTAKAEDYELWTRAVEYTEIVNIPEVLGDYKKSEGSITAQKFSALNAESGEISARIINRTLGISIQPEDIRLLCSWENPLNNSANRSDDLNRLKTILTDIWKSNLKRKFFDASALIEVIAERWHWEKDHVDWSSNMYNPQTLKQAFSDKKNPSLFKRYKVFRANNPKFSVRLKKIFKRVLRKPAQLYRIILRKRFAWIIDELKNSIENWTWDRYLRTDKSIEEWTWERYKRINNTLSQHERLIKENNDLLMRIQTQMSFRANKVPFKVGEEKVRIVFLFQMASFWPNWESFYESCCADERFDVKMFLLRDVVNEKSQQLTAQSFLDSNNIAYEEYDETSLYHFAPHIIVIQTLYDNGHRYPEHRTNYYLTRGYRIVYIPYGIELADTDDARNAHFNSAVIENSWKIYTFSERMKQDYFFRTRYAVRAESIGHPKFDGFFSKERYQLSDEIKSKVNGRKIMLWHIHFTKEIKVKNETVQVTPSISIYKKYLDMIMDEDELFFILLPHPKFTESYEGKCFIDACSCKKNMYIDFSDDYRPSLYAADYMITDRSALMIEAAPTGIPILYMYNEYYNEPLTEAIKPIMETYYQGVSALDMFQFMKMCQNGEDPKKTDRLEAVSIYLPKCDGQIGKRIKDDIYVSLKAESEEQLFEESVNE